MMNSFIRDKRKRQGRAGRILAFLLLLMSFTSQGLAASSPGTRLEIEGIDGGKAILKLAAEPLRTMTATPFHLTLTDGAGNPITGAQVRCDLTMPAMPMPENRPAVGERDGFYWGEAVFTMAGDWQAAFQVAMPDRRLEILIFDIDRVLLK